MFEIKRDYKGEYQKYRYSKLEASRKSKAKARGMWERGELKLPQEYACAECQETKPIAEFILHYENKTGHSKRCRECVNRGRRERRGRK